MAFPTTPTNGQVYITSDGRRYIYTLASDSWAFLGEKSSIKDNLTATIPPIASDDSTLGYIEGSLWIDRTNDKPYYLVDSTIGVAKWVAAGGATVAATLPPSPTLGELAFQTTDGLAYIWIGNAWVDITAAGTSVVGALVAATLPLSPTVGQLVFNSTSGFAFIWDGSVWVDITASGATVAAALPPAPTLGQITLETTNGIAYIWDGSAWIDITAIGATVAATLPLAPVVGQIALETTNGIAYIWNGLAWVDITAKGATIAAVLPPAPTLGQITLETTNGVAYIWDGSAWIDITAAGAAQPQHKFNAILPPAATNDITQGYSVGSRWIDIVGGGIYSCIDSTATLAVWKDLRPIGDGQIWTVVVRATAVVYTNATGRPITLNFSSTLAATLLVGGVVVPTSGTYASVIIPNAATYVITSAGVITASELR